MVVCKFDESCYFETIYQCIFRTILGCSQVLLTLLQIVRATNATFSVKSFISIDMLKLSNSSWCRFNRNLFIFKNVIYISFKYNKILMHINFSFFSACTSWWAYLLFQQSYALIVIRNKFFCFPKYDTM